MMAFALLESLVFTGLVVLISGFLPPSWLKEGFAFMGFIIAVVAAIAAVLFQRALRDDFPSAFMLLVSSVVPLLVIVILIFLIRSMPHVQSLLLNIAERLSILLFLYIAIGILSLLVVVYRNLL